VRGDEPSCFFSVSRLNEAIVDGRLCPVRNARSVYVATMLPIFNVVSKNLVGINAAVQAVAYALVAYEYTTT